MKYLWLFAGVLLLCSLILLVRHWLIRQVDRRISNYQNDLLNRHIEKWNRCTARSGAGGMTTEIIFR